MVNILNKRKKFDSRKTSFCGAQLISLTLPGILSTPLSSSHFMSTRYPSNCPNASKKACLFSAAILDGASIEPRFRYTRPCFAPDIQFSKSCKLAGFLSSLLLLIPRRERGWGYIGIIEGKPIGPPRRFVRENWPDLRLGGESMLDIYLYI